MERDEREKTIEKKGESWWRITWRFPFSDDNKKWLMAGMAIAISVYALTGRPLGVVLGIVAAILTAFAKECLDHRMRKLAWDWSDIVWTIIGGFAGGVVSTIGHIIHG